jgi:hypothetical protein
VIDFGQFVRITTDNDGIRKPGKAFIVGKAHVISPAIGRETIGLVGDAGTGILYWMDSDRFADFVRYGDTAVLPKNDLEVVQ